MNKAILIRQAGGTDVLRWEDVTVEEPGAGQVLLRHTAVGLNMIDTYYRKGLYPMEMPFVPGVEGAGVIEQTGENVSGFAVGQRVAYVTTAAHVGSYCEKRLIDQDLLVPLPDTISDDIAAASLLKGLTAWMLLTRVYPARDKTILVYAAAGGVGSLLCQWAKMINARVIGVVGSGQKVAMAEKWGCDAVIDHSREDVLSRVLEVTDGNKVDVVYDSAGKETFNTSLDCLVPMGTMVSYGNASGPVEPVDILELMRKGSLFLTRPMLFHYIQGRANYLEGAEELFTLIETAKLEVSIKQSFSLSEAAEAHRQLEANMTTGPSVLLP